MASPRRSHSCAPAPATRRGDEVVLEDLDAVESAPRRRRPACPRACPTGRRSRWPGEGPRSTRRRQHPPLRSSPWADMNVLDSYLSGPERLLPSSNPASYSTAIRVEDQQDHLADQAPANPDRGESADDHSTAHRARDGPAPVHRWLCRLGALHLGARCRERGPPDLPRGGGREAGGVAERLQHERAAATAVLVGGAPFEQLAAVPADR